MCLPIDYFLSGTQYSNKVRVFLFFFLINRLKYFLVLLLSLKPGEILNVTELIINLNISLLMRFLLNSWKQKSIFYLNVFCAFPPIPPEQFYIIYL